ncbi:MAG TPA: hypothetical protein VJU82_04935 [Acidobacteriaceae bacterium]|nr:hypothetical protein [Acidobacteriaceae bacterium]
MSSEQNAPEGQISQAPAMPPGQPSGIGSQNEMLQAGGSQIPHGMGQSKSSRRRRRKRKNKGLDAGQANGGQFVAELQAGAAAQQQPQNFQPSAGQQPQPQGGPSTKRWKKKFRGDRQRRDDNPGNQASGNGFGAPAYRDKDTHQPGNTVHGGKRKGKQRDRGPRSFVGPMDHSYRGVNGNFADGPPSTIESHGFGRGNGRAYVSDSQPIDYSVGRPIPIPENAPTKIFFFIEDLFLNAKINETARKLGVKVAFVKNDKEAIAELTSHENEADRPGLIVFDLNGVNVKPLTLIPKLKAKLKKSTSIIGFLQHVQGDLKAKAVEAGCDVVVARAAFSQNLPNLLRRYGLHEEEDESNFNQ